MGHTPSLHGANLLWACMLDESKPLLRGSSNRFLMDDSQEYLFFETPPDLVCPITHEIYKDPVVNSAGQIYEREAILSHFRMKKVDPVTNVPLDNLELTPIYAVKSRAVEYKEKVSKACIEAACKSECRNPVKYLRRAVELCVDSNIRMPGFSSETMEYILMYSSSAYDSNVLQHFACGLRKAGYVDQAANVYYKLLQSANDKSQQAEALKQCLACWSSEDGCDVTLHVLPKLCQFVRTQQQFSIGHILELLSEAQLSRTFILRLCEELLLDSPMDQGAANKNHDVIVRYVKLSQDSIREELAELRRSPVCTLQHPTQLRGEPPKRIFWKRPKQICRAVVMISFLCPPSLMVRGIQAASLLFLTRNEGS